MTVLIKDLGLTDYLSTWTAMKTFSSERTPDSPDELWITEHSPVFTQGQAGKPEHVLFPGSIPIVQTDRGGQVTYHGPGQVVVYTLFDLGRSHLGVRPLVRLLEASVIELLDARGIQAAFRVDAPGVYVENRKIASVGLRIRHGRSYHGLSFNVDMDLKPFSQINPCGFSGLEVTDLHHLGISDSIEKIKLELATRIAHHWDTARSPRPPEALP